MAGVGDVTGMSGQIQSQIGDAAKPSQKQADASLEASTTALSESAGSAATKPTEATAASGLPGASSAAGATAGANTDPNAPRA